MPLHVFTPQDRATATKNWTSADFTKVVGFVIVFDMGEGTPDTKMWFQPGTGTQSDSFDENHWKRLREITTDPFVSKHGQDNEIISFVLAWIDEAGEEHRMLKQAAVELRESGVAGSVFRLMETDTVGVNTPGTTFRLKDFIVAVDEHGGGQTRYSTTRTSTTNTSTSVPPF